MLFSEKIYLKKLKTGDPKAFEYFFFKYHKRVLVFIKNFISETEEAENILQDVFLSIWENKHKININLSFESFLFKIAKNKSLNCLRKTLNKKTYLSYIKENLSDFENTIDKIIDNNELEFYFYKYINELPERRREIFLASIKEGLSYKEIACKFNISENTVDTQIRNSLNYIREKIKKKFEKF